MGVDADVCDDGALYVRLAEAIADAKGVDPLELDPLYDGIDVDAVDRMTAADADPPGGQLRVEFSVAGCDVTVTADRTIEVTHKHATPADD